jgi:hypothetical protein
MKLIALGAYKGTGKSTVARTLVHLHKFIKFSFADPLYDMVLAGFGIDGRTMTTEEKETTIEWLGVSLRYILQTLGTEWGRNTICQDVWLRIMSRKILAAQKAGQDVVIDDVRFENEVQLVQSFEGTVFALYREGVSPGTDEHTSESGIQHFRKVIPVAMYDEPDARKRSLHLAKTAANLVGQCPPTR